MSRRSPDDLVADAGETYSRIEKLPKYGITLDWETEIKNWKSQIADACLALVLKPSQLGQSHQFDAPDSDYCIDLRATVHSLPRRLEGKPKQIDETIKANRTFHEEEIEGGKIICYKATEDGKLVAFEPRSNSKADQVLQTSSIVRQFQHFSFQKLVLQKISPYDIKYCAHPECGKDVGKEGDHLQLCQSHGEKLLHNIEHQWLSAASKKIYDEIKNVAEHDLEGIHHRIYYQLLPQIDAWIEQIDRIIPTDCTGTGTQTSSLDAWLVLQLRPVRLLLMLMKSGIFLYRMHLNPSPMGSIIAALIGLIVFGLRSTEVKEALSNGFVRIIRTICGIFASIFAYLGIGILYTLDIIFSDDANIAIILKTAGGGLAAIGTAVAVMIATPAAVIGGIAIATFGLILFFIGDRMGKEREKRGAPHTSLIQVHLDLKLARERLWQWV